MENPKMKICKTSISDKCITKDGVARSADVFPRHRNECGECYKLRLTKLYAADKVTYLARDKAYKAKKRARQNAPKIE